MLVGGWGGCWGPPPVSPLEVLTVSVVGAQRKAEGIGAAFGDAVGELALLGGRCGVLGGTQRVWGDTEGSGGGHGGLTCPSRATASSWGSRMVQRSFSCSSCKTGEPTITKGLLWGGGDPIRTKGLVWGRGDPTRTKGLLCGGGDPIGTKGLVWGGGDPIRTKGLLWGGGDPIGTKGLV